VTARYTVEGEQHETTGVGYHDHNWGNVGLMKVVHDWYWARGQAGPYSVIASYITSAKRYGFEPIPIFMLAHDNIVIGDDPAKVTFEREGVYTDETTGKPVATTTRYIYQDDEDRYVVSFTRTRDLTLNPMIDNIRGFKHVAARLAHFDGAYLRFAGDLEVSHHRGSEHIETHKDEAIWELMYFGRARDEGSQCANRMAERTAQMYDVVVVGGGGGGTAAAVGAARAGARTQKMGTATRWSTGRRPGYRGSARWRQAVQRALSTSVHLHHDASRPTGGGVRRHRSAAAVQAQLRATVGTSTESPMIPAAISSTLKLRASRRGSP
jgi:hypothetical protein